MIEFRIGRHSAGRGTVVEVYHEVRLIATIYGHIDVADRPQLHLVTKHGVDVDVCPPTNLPQLSDVVITIEEREI